MTCAATAGSSAPGGDAHPLEERLRRRPQRRRQRQRLVGRRGQPGEPRAEELVEPLRHRQRLERVDVRVERAGQLQCEERIPARPLVDAEQRLASERPPQAVVQEPMERADAERTDRQPLQALRCERLLELRRLGPVGEPPGEQHEHRARGEPSQGERECAGRGCIEPLHVVDGEQHGLPLAEQVQRIADRHGQGALIDGSVRGLLPEQRDLERASPRPRDQGSDVGEGVLQQIAQPCVREAALGFRRARREDAQPTGARMFDSRQPEQRLADSGLALEHERSNPMPRPGR